MISNCRSSTLWSLFLWVFITPQIVHSQCPADLPDRNNYGTGAFQIKVLGNSCLPRTILMKNGLEDAINTKTIFDYRGGPIIQDSLTTDSIHTYKRPGIYTIVQFSEKNGRKLVACPRVYVPDTLPPNVRLIPCGNLKVKVTFDSNQPYLYDFYSISWGDGTIQEVNSSIRSLSHSYATQKEYNIEVWGFQKPGNCGSKKTELTFSPGLTTQKPSIQNLFLKEPGKVTIEVSNPLRLPLLLLRIDNDGNWVQTGHEFLTTNSKMDVKADSEQDACFRLVTTDTCLMQSYISETICIPNLNAFYSTTSNQLTWTISPLQAQSSLALWKDGTLWKSLGTSDKGEIIDEDLNCGVEHCYQLVVSTPQSNSYSRKQCRLTPGTACSSGFPIYIPDAFSPNGDGINDFFSVTTPLPASFQLEIFNAWGIMIFQTNNPQKGWNGTYNDTLLPPGAYVYRVRVKGSSLDPEYVKSGTVYLIR